MKGRLFLWSSIITLLMVWSVALAKKLGPHQADLDVVKAPATAQSLKDPYAGQSEAALAGQKLFKVHCARCHGTEGRGKGKAADLHLPLIQKTSAGTLFWFLKHGNSTKGMPTWSSLPDRELWQIVTFLETLQ